MRRGVPLALLLTMTGPASAYTLTTGGGRVGDRPSRFAPVEFPGSRFAERPKASGAAVSEDGSSFVLKGMDSATKARTETALSGLGARQDGDRIVVTLPSDVLFDFDKSDIRPDARPVLGRLADILRAMRGAPVAITGHTDAKGSDAYNQALSERRAVAVRRWLEGLGIRGRRMRTAGRGESAPVAANTHADGRDDPDGRQKNRRVEFVIVTGS